eukprot:COSAG02_NODE_721_length_18054_cov_3.613422_11_plen_2053_part_00
MSPPIPEHMRAQARKRVHFYNNTPDDVDLFFTKQGVPKKMFDIRSGNKSGSYAMQGSKFHAETLDRSKKYGPWTVDDSSEKQVYFLIDPEVKSAPSPSIGLDLNFSSILDLASSSDEEEDESDEEEQEEVCDAEISIEGVTALAAVGCTTVADLQSLDVSIVYSLHLSKQDASELMKLNAQYAIAYAVCVKAWAHVAKGKSMVLLQNFDGAQAEFKTACEMKAFDIEVRKAVEDEQETCKAALQTWIDSTISPAGRQIVSGWLDAGVKGCPDTPLPMPSAAAEEMLNYHLTQVEHDLKQCLTFEVGTVVTKHDLNGHITKGLDEHGEVKVRWHWWTHDRWKKIWEAGLEAAGLDSNVSSVSVEPASLLLSHLDESGWSKPNHGNSPSYLVSGGTSLSDVHTKAIELSINFQPDEYVKAACLTTAATCQLSNDAISKLAASSWGSIEHFMKIPDQDIDALGLNATDCKALQHTAAVIGYRAEVVELLKHELTTDTGCALSDDGLQKIAAAVFIDAAEDIRQLLNNITADEVNLLGLNSADAKALLLFCASGSDNGTRDGDCDVFVRADDFMWAVSRVRTGEFSHRLHVFIECMQLHGCEVSESWLAVLLVLLESEEGPESEESWKRIKNYASKVMVGDADELGAIIAFFHTAANCSMNGSRRTYQKGLRTATRSNLLALTTLILSLQNYNQVLLQSVPELGATNSTAVRSLALVLAVARIQTTSDLIELNDSDTLRQLAGAGLNDGELSIYRDVLAAIEARRMRTLSPAIMTSIGLNAADQQEVCLLNLRADLAEVPAQHVRKGIEVTGSDGRIGTVLTDPTSSKSVSRESLFTRNQSAADTSDSNPQEEKRKYVKLTWSDDGSTSEFLDVEALAVVEMVDVELSSDCMRALASAGCMSADDIRSLSPSAAGNIKWSRSDATILGHFNPQFATIDKARCVALALDSEGQRLSAAQDFDGARAIFDSVESEFVFDHTLMESINTHRAKNDALMRVWMCNELDQLHVTTAARDMIVNDVPSVSNLRSLRRSALEDLTVPLEDQERFLKPRRVSLAAKLEKRVVASLHHLFHGCSCDGIWYTSIQPFVKQVYDFLECIGKEKLTPPVVHSLCRTPATASEAGSKLGVPWTDWPPELRAACQRPPPFPDIVKRAALKKGNDLRDSGDYHGAMAMYSHSWTSGNESPVLFNQMAILYSHTKLKNFDFQELLYSAAIDVGTEAHSDAYVWYNNRRKSRKRAENIAGAIGDCKTVIRLSPDTEKGRRKAQECREDLQKLRGLLSPYDGRPQHVHALKPLKRNGWYCNICRRSDHSRRYRCTEGCDWDMCGVCWDENEAAYLKKRQQCSAVETAAATTNAEKSAFTKLDPPAWRDLLEEMQNCNKLNSFLDACGGNDAHLPSSHSDISQSCVLSASSNSSNAKCALYCNGGRDTRWLSSNDSGTHWVELQAPTDTAIVSVKLQTGGYGRGYDPRRVEVQTKIVGQTSWTERVSIEVPLRQFETIELFSAAPSSKPVVALRVAILASGNTKIGGLSVIGGLIRKIELGAQVKVGDAISVPQFGWGAAEHAVGTVRHIHSNGCVVDFPEQIGWYGMPDELIVVDQSESRSQQSGTSESALARPESIVCGYGRNKHGRFTLYGERTLNGNVNMMAVNKNGAFPMQLHWDEASKSLRGTAACNEGEVAFKWQGVLQQETSTQCAEPVLEPEPEAVPEAVPAPVPEPKPNAEFLTLGPEARFRLLYAQLVRENSTEDGGESAEELERIASTLTEQGLDVHALVQEIKATVKANEVATSSGSIAAGADCASGSHAASNVEEGVPAGTILKEAPCKNAATRLEDEGHTAEEASPSTRSRTPERGGKREATTPRRSAKVKVMQDYKAKGEGEISIAVGDVVQVTNTTDGDWWEGQIEGVSDEVNFGYFPKTFVELIDGAEFTAEQIAQPPCTDAAVRSAASCRVSVEHLSNTWLRVDNSADLSEASSNDGGKTQAAATQRAMVTYGYDAEDETCISISVGDVVVLTDTSDVDWWEGYVESTPASVGWFPASFVVKLRAAQSLRYRFRSY